MHGMKTGEAKYGQASPALQRGGRRLLDRIGGLCLIAVLLSMLAACAGMAKEPSTRQLGQIAADPGILPGEMPRGEVLRVASLNVAHGRRDGANQVFLGADTFRHNLSAIAEALRRYRPAVVALQEADAESWWSGGFDHVAYLAAEAGYPWRLHAHNVDSWFSTFGTALLSRLPLFDALEHTFAASPPTLSKGLVLASIRWPADGGAEARTIDVVSVHLDFSRRSVREGQIRELQALLDQRMNPTIIMGDFNSEWFKEASVIKALARGSRFHAYAPEAVGYDSYKDKRLDWILISRDLQFVDYRVVDETLSDHAMLLAGIRFIGPMKAEEGE